MKTYLFFDTETNGLPARYDAPITDSQNWPHILQFAWVLTYEDGTEIHRSNDVIRLPDGVRLDAGAAEVHGLTADRLEGGISIFESFSKFGVSLGLTDVLVAHNIDFDRCIVQAELHRQNQQISIQSINELPKVCTMKSATNFCAIPGGRRGYKWPRLDQLHQKLFNEGFDGAHDAMNDVEALMRCFWALKERGVLTA